MKTGKLLSWSERGYGLVAVTFREIYFLHSADVVEAPDGMLTPPIGVIVHFDTAPAQNNGRYPRAINARILVSAPVASVNGGAQ